ncbi:molybdenum cofactor guanylyltransferase [Desulfonema ishimotonii]|uniref:Probable molybdenum cofactor guanylyltransferase n=2 Tax=Desulfonema ishimotonii TaxID=45657 RepID=A0A401G172_9BACT|nr:molybdenum cofactor guanylyltransferase [Desulfonema ishimotonii]
MTYPCSGVILAGGLSTRFSGRNKALIQVGGRSVLDRICSLFQELFDDIILVTNEPLRYLEWDLTITTDMFPVRSSLTGIHAGLFAATRPYAFCTACDTPFLKKEVVEMVLERLGGGHDVIVPEISAGFEPLCAAYSKRCLEVMARHIAQEQLQIKRLFRKFRVRTVSEQRLLEKDPDLLSFFNINAPEDLVKAERLLAGALS